MAADCPADTAADTIRDALYRLVAQDRFEQGCADEAALALDALVAERDRYREVAKATEANTDTHDPLHDALVAIFEAIAEREGKSIEEVVAEFVEGYFDAC